MKLLLNRNTILIRSFLKSFPLELLFSLFGTLSTREIVIQYTISLCAPFMRTLLSRGCLHTLLFSGIFNTILHRTPTYIGNPEMSDNLRNRSHFYLSLFYIILISDIIENPEMSDNSRNRSHSYSTLLLYTLSSSS